MFLSKDLWQEFGLSLLLFNILPRKDTEWRESCGDMGFPIDKFYLYTLSFTDDQVVFIQDAYDVELC